MPNGNYDCIFLKEIDPPAQPASKQGKLESAEVLPMKRRGCSIYPVRPLQCRTWPFWHGNLASRQAWDLASKKCPGMDRGKREFSQIQIEELRDARDWPEKPADVSGMKMKHEDTKKCEEEEDPWPLTMCRYGEDICHPGAKRRI